MTKRTHCDCGKKATKKLHGCEYVCERCYELHKKTKHIANMAIHRTNSYSEMDYSGIINQRRIL